MSPRHSTFAILVLDHGEHKALGLNIRAGGSRVTSRIIIMVHSALLIFAQHS